MPPYSNPPQVRSLAEILPDESLLMMGAGPVPIPEAVARANSVVINHLGRTMSTIVDQVKSMARYVFQTESEWVLGVAGPGSAAMEMAICNLVEPGQTVLSVNNGFFSQRMAEMSRRLGAQVQVFDVPNHQTASVQEIERQIELHRPDCVTIVQGETSNTVFNRELPAIAKAAKKHGCLVIVDAVCTLSTMPLEMDAWMLDAVITGGQKGLSSIPGVSLIAFSNEAWRRISERKTPNTHWCLDAKLAENFWHKGSYHYTAPVSGVLALHEALRLVCAETLPTRFERHARCSSALQHSMEAMGLSLFAVPQARLNSVVGITVPTGLTGAAICTHISDRYHVEISGSFGLPIVRVGQMGEQCREHNLFRTVHALGSTLRDLGAKVDLPIGMAALESSLQSRPIPS
ncbi:MAG: alanine--glyoxylate aminotransferase family protein [Burkholderiales bacterium]|nr:alanine--glyoxylate aminotransferase family protein [Burkholderiales bacterium]